ncbi:hypothetical protein [Hyalangium versicolor]|uniref:hypothetical protein n=1 Tax=Hyalangium versicolor TaxID=2861190 RepID=UPI001CD02AC7|nr:hypothetical protein [Hyalangium versicolor]
MAVGQVAVTLEKEQPQAEEQARVEEKRPVVATTRAYRCPCPVGERQVGALARAKEGSGRGLKVALLTGLGPRLPPRLGE